MNPGRAARWSRAVLVYAVGVELLLPSIRADQQATGSVASPAAAAVAAEFCTSSSRYGSPVVMVGPRARIAWPVPEGDSGVPQRWLQLIQSQPQFHIAASGSWVLVHDVERGLSFRRSCAAPTGDALPVAGRPLRVAISSTGDVAAAMVGGPLRVYLNSGPTAPGAYAGGFELGVDGEPPSEVLWYGRRLVVLAPSKISLVDFAVKERSLVREMTSLPVEAGSASHGFVFNGLTYVLRNRCFDIHLPPTLEPRLRRAACIAGESNGVYLAIDKLTIRALNATGTLLWQRVRPSAVSAQFSGTTRQMGVALAAVATAWWIPKPSIDEGARRGASSGGSSGFWRDWFTRDWWESGTEYAKAMQALDQRQWRDLAPEGAWHTAPGLAIRATGNQFDFVTPDKRNLTQLERQVYQESGYSDEQVRQIFTENVDLSSTLEGQLFAAGWIPIATESRMTGGRPLAFDAMPTFGCVQSDAPSESIALLRKGVRLGGGVHAGLARALNDPESFDLKADEVMVWQCHPPLSPGARSLPRRFLVLRQAALRGRRNNAIVDLPRASLMVEGVRFTRGLDSEWPVAIDGTVVVAVDPTTPAALPKAMRTWMNRWLPYYEGDLLLPVARVEAVIAIEAGTSPSVTAQAVKLALTEVTPAAARTLNGCSPTEAVKQRAADGTLIGLDRVSALQRTLEVRIGIAEHAVALLEPAFERSAGGRVWVKPTPLGSFEVVEPPLPLSQTSRRPSDLNHGTKVAAIVAAQKNLPGVLQNVELVWVDLQDGAAGNLGILTRLAGRRGIVNVSQDLGEGWSTLEPQAAGPWSQRLLFVAAAANDGQIDHGFPLRWRTAKVNVLGVGVAQSDGTILATAPYDREFIDLLAAGSNVPSVNEAGIIECDSGTSFAAAYVSSIAALLTDMARGFSIGAIRARLLATAKWQPAYSGRVKGGLLDAARALDALDVNRLTLEKSGFPDLVLDVDIIRTGPSASITVAPTDADPLSIAWESILRVHRLSPRPGESASRYRIAYIRDRKYVVHDEAVISSSSILPIRHCKAVGSGDEVACEDLAIERLIDYVAKITDFEVLGF